MLPQYGGSDCGAGGKHDCSNGYLIKSRIRRATDSCFGNAWYRKQNRLNFSRGNAFPPDTDDLLLPSDEPESTANCSFGEITGTQPPIGSERPCSCPWISIVPRSDVPGANFEVTRNAFVL